MSAVVLGLIGGAIAFGLITLAQRRQKSAAIVNHGWKALRSGRLVNGCIIGTAALAAFFGYFLLNGGSALPDAQMQNSIAAAFLTASASYVLYMTWMVFGRTIMWKGRELRVCTVTGKEATRHIADVTDITKLEFLGEYRLTFRDKSTLRFSEHLNGADELVKRLPRRASRSGPLFRQPLGTARSVRDSNIWVENKHYIPVTEGWFTLPSSKSHAPAISPSCITA